MKAALKLSSVLALALLIPAFAAHADTLTTSGDVTVVNGSNGSPAWQLTSSSSTAGSLVLTISGTLTAADIKTLSTDYQMISGSFAGGSPRFSITDGSGNSAYVYFGSPTGTGAFTDANAGAYGNTGNYADLLSSDGRVDVNGFGGSSAYEETWAQFITNDGNVDVTSISLVLDGGWDESQVIDIEDFDLNGTPYNPAATPEPASLLLLATGLLGAAGETFRRYRRNAS